MNRVAIACGQLALLDQAEPLRFDAAEAVRRKIAGQERAMEHAGESWKERAVEIVRQVAMERDTFTSDQVRAAADAAGLPEAEGRGWWGAVYAAAAKAGYCRRTNRVEPCERVAAKGHLALVWESLLR